MKVEFRQQVKAILNHEGYESKPNMKLYLKKNTVREKLNKNCRQVFLKYPYMDIQLET